MSWQAFISASFKDKNGNVVVFQRPNAPIVIWFICTVLNKFITQATVHRVLEITGLAALLVWAWLEIAYGANYFRRALGTLVFISAIMLHSGAV